MSIIPRHPILTIEQVDRLSNIFDNAGQVALGAFVFAQFTSGFDRSNLLVLLFGVGTVLVCWAMSLLLARRRRENYEI